MPLSDEDRWERTNDEVDCSRAWLGVCVIGTGHAACPSQAGGRPGHSGSPRVRARASAHRWCLRAQQHRACDCPQVPSQENARRKRPLRTKAAAATAGPAREASAFPDLTAAEFTRRLPDDSASAVRASSGCPGGSASAPRHTTWTENSMSPCTQGRAVISDIGDRQDGQSPGWSESVKLA